MAVAGALALATSDAEMIGRIMRALPTARDKYDMEGYLTRTVAKALASKSACMACHAVDKKLVGPAFKDVAAKHKGQADALEKVAARIKSGGSGLYGPVPMPPQANLKDDELKLLAGWVLAGAPDQ